MVLQSFILGRSPKLCDNCDKVARYKILIEKTDYQFCIDCKAEYFPTVPSEAAN